MFSDIGDVSSIQRDGRPPTVVTAGAAPGESGVAVMHLRYQGGAYFHADLRQHFVAFASAGPSTLRVAGKTLQHDAVEAGLCIFPAGIDMTVDCDSDVRSLLIAIDPDCLALASAEDSAAGARLIERSYGHDESLRRLGQLLADECADGYPRGTLFWNETASRLVARLVASHTTGAKPANGVLGGDTLRRIRDYLMANLDEPIDVATLAGMSGRSQFHFSRIFRRGRRQSLSLRRSPAPWPRRRTGARWQTAAGRDRSRHRLRRSEPSVPLGETGARRIDDPADNPAGGIGAAPRDWAATPRRWLMVD
jgi:AraC family transcriptional regulator